MAREFLSRPRWTGLSRRISYEDKLRIWKVVGYTPHAAQEVVHRSTARFKVVNCGRRWGKTEGVQTHELIVILSLGGWAFNVAGDYDTASILFESVVNTIANSPLNELFAEDPRMAKGHQRLVLKTGGVLWAKSKHDERRIRGRGLDFVAEDEDAMHPSMMAWTQALRPSLSDRLGGAIATSTPKGRNHFKEKHDWGNKSLLSPGELDRHPDWESWTFPSSSNPFLDPAEIVAAERDLSQAEFLQEFMAVFLDDKGGVFRGYMDVANVEMVTRGPYAIEARDMQDQPVGLVHTSRYAIGVDIAIHLDWTVIWVVEVFTGRTVYVERFNQVDWDGISSRVKWVAGRYLGAPIVVDATNNASFVDKLQSEIFTSPVDGFIFTKQSKAHVINELALAIEKGEFWLPEAQTSLAKIILREFGAMQFTKNPTTGNIKMEAPAGEHDDCPIAAALARYAAATGITGIPLIPGETRSTAEGLREMISSRSPSSNQGPRQKKRFRRDL